MVHVMMIKPKFVGMREQERIENGKNFRGTIIGASAVVGAMAMASTIAKTQRGQNVSSFVAESRPVKAAADIVNGAKSAITSQIVKPGSVLNRVVNAAIGVKDYFKSMPKTVKIAGGIALAAISALHIYDKGRIKSQFEGYKSANELGDKASQSVQDIMDKTSQILGIRR